MEELRVLVPNGMLGYGFPLEDFERGMKRQPHGIVVDAGSTDSGPQKLALGEMTCPESAYYKELSVLVPAAKKAGIPLIVSSAGGDGTNQHVDLFIKIVEQIANEQELSINLAKIYSDIPKEQIDSALQDGKITAMQNVPELTQEEVDQTTVVTAQMGAEPYLTLLKAEKKPDVIIGGRTYDPAPTAALGMYYGFDSALAWHMGKIIECGAICCVPAGKTVLGTLRSDHFLIEPMNLDAKALPHTVAAHTMYEKSSAFNLPGPGGTLNLEECEFKAETDRTTRISGSRFIKDENYTVKLEGAKVVGYRSITVMGVRDPILISQMDEALAYVKEQMEKELPEECSQSQIIFHPYGKNATMKNLESLTDEAGHEMCVIAEVAAPTQEMAQLVVNRIRTTLLHYGYPGRVATSGNIGMPFTPLEIPLGKVCQFNVYHLLKVEEPVAQFPVIMQEVGK
ncbi:acyclic terpene utilization AtuA family protein [Tetragenococcus koreensis]|uniref:3-methylaspartate ammonia-lyase n=1 Tax=Tetragenococcus koreensis TaxID=290335 RepID=A0AAN4UD55_9ENTE|nr:acyclic terpene utilization AtuA family protein [Tetragenococcus koreensis]GEQ50264.1 3-methylaspartate ammonia-lyase [Tetragenococcus koreensis]GEQ52746.1 3-methylaspartate ammonia-lyase [Tetragenococcus koreensis]GEQ55262.1 3-methylaspartate ammonia-lyase [Tetragenococcus koreensis]GEQ57753.1 3-methylaspartate ammonia-lyase [Tetragenococcus koreensis]GEQ60282.1 3-methylaspartate ammonia-lyase [Tetragenococcus koreensis]